MQDLWQAEVNQYAKLLILNALLIVGAWKCLQPGMILGAYGDWMTRKVGDFWSKPLYDCPPCMSSIWGVAFFFAAGLYHIIPWYLFPLHSLALCGLVTLAMMRGNE